MFVSFTLLGVDVFQKGLADAQAGLGKVADAAQQAGTKAAGFMGAAAAKMASAVQAGAGAMAAALGSVQPALANLSQGVKLVGDLAFAAFTRAGLPLAGLVTAGVAASSMGQQLQFQMERLSRTVAGLFGPEVQKVIGLVTALTDKLQSLTDAQRAQLVRWVEAAAAALAVAVVLPRLVSGVEAVVGAVRALSAALATSGWGAVLIAVGALAAAFLGVGAGAEVAQGGIGQLWETLKPLIGAFAQVAGQVMEALKPLLAVAAQLFEGVVGAVMSVMPTIMQVVGILADAFKGLMAQLSPLVPLVVGIFRQAAEFIAALLPPIAELVAALVEALAPVLQVIVLLVGAVLKVFLALAPAIVALVKVLVAVLVPVLKLVAWLFEQVARGVAWLLGVNLDKQAKFKMDVQAEPGRGPAPKRPGGPEAIDALWTRLAQASRMLGTGIKTPEEEHLDVARKQLEEQKATTNAVRGIKPPVQGGSARG